LCCSPAAFSVRPLLLGGLPPGPRSAGHVDDGAVAICAVGVGGPVFALIAQPRYGWGDPLVLVPLVVGIALLPLFLAWERRSPAPMMPLQLFSSRNFSAGNLTTFAMYAGLSVATFVLVLFIQQVGGYTPVQAGLSLLPITLTMFALSRRFGQLADRLGPHLFMGSGPIVAGVGLLLLIRTGPSANYPADMLPAVLVFSLGLAATVAISGAEPMDSLVVQSLGGNDTLNASGLPAGVIGLTLDGGAGKDTLIGSDGERPDVGRL